MSKFPINIQPVIFRFLQLSFWCFLSHAPKMAQKQSDTAIILIAGTNPFSKNIYFQIFPFLIQVFQ